MIIETSVVAAVSMGAIKLISQAIKSWIERRPPSKIEIKLSSGRRIKVEIGPNLDSAEKNEVIAKAIEADKAELLHSSESQ
jgi:hypothetical protein